MYKEDATSKLIIQKLHRNMKLKKAPIRLKLHIKTADGSMN